jgi:membrane fusion protein (multidrug efflux system)
MSENNDLEQSETKSAEKKSGNGKRKRTAAILFIIFLAAAVSGFTLWVHARTHIKTDDAFVESHIYSISSRVSGHVTVVPVNDNQYIKKGDLLVELDPSDYQAKVTNNAAQLDIAKNETASIYAQVEAAKAALNSDRAKLEQADLDFKRGYALYRKEVIPKEQLDRLETARKVAASKLKETEGSVRRAMALLGLTGPGARDAQIDQKRAELQQARLNLSYTKIYAPANGYITRKSVEPGNNVQPGQALMALVSLQDSWITANYKESQLTHVRPGQKVEFTVDSYPGRIFRGVVDSIMAGTGAAFSLLPPENATGNYVKVVQRIPVKILIDRTSDPRHLLRVGMSVEPTILTGQRFSEVLKRLNPFLTMP